MAPKKHEERNRHKERQKYLIKIHPTRLFGPTRLIGTWEYGAGRRFSLVTNYPIPVSFISGTLPLFSKKCLPYSLVPLMAWHKGYLTLQYPFFHTIFGPVFLYERAGFCTKNSKYFCHNDWPSIYNCAKEICGLQFSSFLKNIGEVNLFSLFVSASKKMDGAASQKICAWIRWKSRFMQQVTDKPVESLRNFYC